MHPPTATSMTRESRVEGSSVGTTNGVGVLFPFDEGKFNHLNMREIRGR